MIFKIDDLVHHVRRDYPQRNGIYRINYVSNGIDKKYPYVLKSLDNNHNGLMSSEDELFKPNKFFLRLYGIKD